MDYLELFASWAVVLAAVLALRFVFWLIYKAVNLALPHLPYSLRRRIINWRLARARFWARAGSNPVDEGYKPSDDPFENGLPRINPGSGLPMVGMGFGIDAGGYSYGDGPGYDDDNHLN